MHFVFYLELAEIPGVERIRVINYDIIKQNYLFVKSFQPLSLQHFSFCFALSALVALEGSQLLLTTSFLGNSGQVVQ
jgi:hypothetical protein